MSRLYPPKIEQFIANNYIEVESKELAVKINITFGTNYTVAQIKSYKSNHNLPSGFDSRFRVGRIPANKGKKGEYPKGCEKGWFKKGQVPINHRPVGSERIESKDGYTLVKTAEHKKWELKQHVVWREHGRSVKKGYKIMFLDGDKTNFNINNLTLISNEEMLIMNRHNLRYQKQELTVAGMLIAKVINKRNKQLKKIKQNTT